MFIDSLDMRGIFSVPRSRCDRADADCAVKHAEAAIVSFDDSLSVLRKLVKFKESLLFSFLIKEPVVFFLGG